MTHQKTRLHTHQRNAQHAYLQHTPTRTALQCRAPECQQPWPCDTYLRAKEALFVGVNRYGVPQWKNPPTPTTRKPRPHPTLTFQKPQPRYSTP